MAATHWRAFEDAFGKTGWWVAGEGGGGVMHKQGECNHTEVGAAGGAT